MASAYYKPCPELDRCNELIEKYWETGQYEKCFSGYLPLAGQGYPLAECQIGYFYLEGRGVEKDLDKSFYIGQNGRPSTATGTASSIWAASTRRVPLFPQTWKRPGTGTGRPPFRAMTWR